jgi:hypothetical protein
MKNLFQFGLGLFLIALAAMLFAPEGEVTAALIGAFAP